MKRSVGPWLVALAAVCLSLASYGRAAMAQGQIVFVSHRPPRELTGNIRGWAGANTVHSYTEDTSTHTWHVQYMAFLSRVPNSAEVTLVFYHIERDRQNTRRYVYNESVTLSSPTDTFFYGNATLHRSPDEFQPMENYEVRISVSDSRGQHEIARGRIGLVGEVERHSGVVDFTHGTPITH